MIRIRLVTLGIFLCMLLMSIAAHGAMETSHLIFRDKTWQLSDEQVRRLAKVAERALEQILEFWSADPRLEQLGKIQVELEPPKREIYGALFHWREEKGRRSRIVSVFGATEEPQMMVHKLTHAVFPNPDKLIRNMMGIPMEARFGNYLSFPMCGFNNDVWVLAFRQVKSYIPLAELGPNHEQWGMTTRRGQLVITDKIRQHITYAEAGSFGAYLLGTYGRDKVVVFNRLSRQKGRPWMEVFGLPSDELEKNWIQALDSTLMGKEQDVSVLKRLLERSPDRACIDAQGLAIKARKSK